MYFRIFFVLNRVRVSKSQRLTYTQILVEYPPPPPGVVGVVVLGPRLLLWCCL